MLVENIFFLYIRTTLITFDLNKYRHSISSVDKYSIADFNAKVNAEVLLKIQERKFPHIADLKLVIEENEIFTGYNSFLILIFISRNFYNKI